MTNDDILVLIKKYCKVNGITIPFIDAVIIDDILNVDMYGALEISKNTFIQVVPVEEIGFFENLTYIPLSVLIRQKKLNELLHD
jgi:hypothetical protein